MTKSYLHIIGKLIIDIKFLIILISAISFNYLDIIPFPFVAIFFLILFFYYILKNNTNTKIFLYLIFTFIISLIYLCRDFYQLYPISKILVFNFTIFFIYFQYLNSISLYVFIKKYINFSFLVCLIGIFQELIYIVSGHVILEKISKFPDVFELFGIKFIRIFSIFDEPHIFGEFIFLPLALLIFYREEYQIKNRFLYLFIFFISLTLTFSTTSVIGLILILFFAYKRFIIKMIFIFILFYTVFNFKFIYEKLAIYELLNNNFQFLSSASASSIFSFIGFHMLLNKISIFGIGLLGYANHASEIWLKIDRVEASDDGSNFGIIRYLIELGIFIPMILAAIYFYLCSKIIDNSIKNTFRIITFCILAEILRFGVYINPILILHLAMLAHIAFRNSSFNAIKVLNT